MSNSIREAIALIAANPELFAAAVDKKTGTIDVDTLETFAVRGDALLVIGRKTTFSADVPEDSEQSAQDDFLDMLFSLAETTQAGVKKSGTSGQHRIAVGTPYGKLTVTLDPAE